MQVLLLTNRIPYPLHDGGNLAVHQMMTSLIEAGVSVSLLSMNTSKHFVNIEQLPKIYEQLSIFEHVFIDNAVTKIGAFKNLFTNKSYNIDRFISSAFNDRLLSILSNHSFDIIQFEGLFVTPYLSTIRAHSKAKIIYRQHNVEYIIWERLAQQSTQLIKKSYLKLLASRMKSYELSMLNKYDALLAISNTDAEQYESLGCKLPMYTYGYGLKADQYPFCPLITTPLSIYHIGAMDWLPNQEGIDWFLQKVWSKVIEQKEDIQLFLAGRNMPDSYFAYQNEQTHIVGEVPDAVAFEEDKSILIVPILSGGGIRIKILQAMAMGKTVITTSIGLQGINAVHNQHLIVADTATEFINALLSLPKNPTQILEIGKAAKQLMSTVYEEKDMTKRLLAFYSKIIN